MKAVVEVFRTRIVLDPRGVVLPPRLDRVDEQLRHELPIVSLRMILSHRDVFFVIPPRIVDDLVIVPRRDQAVLFERPLEELVATIGIPEVSVVIESPRFVVPAWQFDRSAFER